MIFAHPDLENRIKRFIPSYPRRQMLDRLGRLHGFASVDRARAAGPWAVREERAAQEEAARRRVSEERLALSRGEGSEEAVSRAEADAKRERKLTEAATAGFDSVIARAHDSERLFESVAGYVTGLPWPVMKKSLPVETVRAGPRDDLSPVEEPPLLDIDVVQVMLPKSTELGEIIERQQSIIAAHASELEGLPSIPERIETARRRVRQAVAELAASGAPRAELVDQFSGGDLVNVAARVIWPQAKLDVAPSRPGSVPRTIDPAALLCWLAQDKVFEALESDLVRQYSGHGIQLDPHEKSRRKRELKAEILAAERLEAHAGWQLIEAGDDAFRFRPDLSPRALLGIS